MSKNEKPTVRQAHWLSHLEQAQSLKLPLAQYCRSRGLNVQSLYNARHELLGKSRGVSGRARTRKAVTKASRFVAVELAPTPMAMRVSGPACRIELRHVVIECAQLPEAGWLLALSKGVSDVVP
jgi:hypothetical protein